MMDRRVLVGGMSEDEAVKFLQDTAIGALRKKAGYIAPVTFFPVPDDGAYRKMLYDTLLYIRNRKYRTL